jgi:hypothetical protein
VIPASARWRNLGTAGAAAAAALFAGFDLYQWALAYAADRFHNDFTFYFAAARIGVTHGWGSIYDLGLQQAQLDAMGSGITIAELARYISPPPVAWLALPFTVLPYPAAYWAWSALLVAALVVAWQVAAPGSGRARVIFLLAAVGWLPVIYALQLGQPGLLVAAGVAASCALVRAKQPVWAGVALAVLVLKPQLAVLVPPALLVARQYRAFAAATVAVGVLAVASIVALGPDGVNAYLARLNFASGVPVNKELTLSFLLGGAARPAQVFIAAWTMLIAFRLRSRGPEWVYSCALAGGLLATPYAHLDDLVMLGLAGWLCLRAGAPAWTWPYAFAVAVAAEGVAIWGSVPVLAGELGFVALLSVAALRPERAPARAPAQPDRSPQLTTLR